MGKNISISYLDAKNVNDFFESLKDLKVWIHVDVMDSKFVKNNGVDMKYIKKAKELGFFVDTHLMVEKPFEDEYIDKAIFYGTDSLTIHQEIDDFELVLDKLNIVKKQEESEGKKLQIGIAVKPNTDIKVLEKYKTKFDLLLLMSVEPGLGGQKYIEKTNEKIKEARKLFKDKIIQVDGGINFDTFIFPYISGCDSFVMGSYFSKSKDVVSSYQALEILIQLEECPKKLNVDFEKRILQIVPGGYGFEDILIGISSPELRKFANKFYKVVSLNTLHYFLNSNVHEHRKFALFSLSKMAKSKNVNLKEIVEFVDDNLEKINNWDLTDEVSPNVIGKYLLTLSDKEKVEKLNIYFNSKKFWINRIGIVSCLALARAGDYMICESVAKKYMYSDNHLLQKAVGWLLREVYKKHPSEIVSFLKENNKDKKIGKFVISYACEKMTQNEKNEIKNNVKGDN